MDALASIRFVQCPEHVKVILQYLCSPLTQGVHFIVMELLRKVQESVLLVNVIKFSVDELSRSTVGFHFKRNFNRPPHK